MIFVKRYEQMCELQHFLHNWIDLKLPSLKMKKLFFCSLEHILKDEQKKLFIDTQGNWCEHKVFCGVKL